MTPQAILFDLDGTLLDSAPDFIAVANTMLQQRQLPALNEQAFTQVVSAGAKEMVAVAFNMSKQDPDFEALRLEFLERYLQHCTVYSKPYAGIESILKHIEQARLPWGVVTNKPVRFAAPIVEKLFNNRAAVLVCPEHVTCCKPDPEPLLLAAQQLAIKPQHIVYVGDDRRDIEAGNRAGCQTIAVTYGYVHCSENPQTWGAEVIMRTVTELELFIKQLLLVN